MTTPIPPDGWPRIAELLRARHLAVTPTPQPDPEDAEIEAQLQALERGLAAVVTNATRRPAPTPLVCEP